MAITDNQSRALAQAEVRLCVLGGSETLLPWGKTWVNHLQDAFDSEGIGVQVFATGSSKETHYSALTEADPLTGITNAQLTSEKNPDVIIIELGTNDAITATDGRTQEEIIADAHALYEFFRTNNPDAFLLYSRLMPYDEERHGALPVSSIKKKYCSPWMHEASTIPGDTGLFTSETKELNKILSTVMQNKLENWRALDSTSRSLADLSVDTSYFRPARMGMTTRDRSHLNTLGHYFILSKIWREFQTNAVIRNAVPILQGIRDIGSFVDFDALWSSVVKLDSTRDGYDFDADFLSGKEYPLWEGLFAHNDLLVNFVHWGNTRRPEIGYTDEVNKAAGDLFSIWISNLWPGQEVRIKLWLDTESEPTAWSGYSPPRYTSSTGGFINTVKDVSGYASGHWLLKINVGKDTFGPFSINVS